MSIESILTISIPSVITIMGFIVSYKHMIKQIKTNKIYETKFNAIMDSLNVLDTYISWMQISNIGNQLPVREQTTK